MCNYLDGLVSIGVFGIALNIYEFCLWDFPQIESSLP